MQDKRREVGNQIDINLRGLDDRTVSKMRDKFGANDLSEKKKDGFLRQLLHSFNDPIIKILLGALAINAIVSLGNINIPETLGIAAAILIATLVSTVSEYSSSLAFEKLKRGSSSTTCRVRRNGRLEKVLVSDIVVGDIVLISAGMKVPADGVLVSGSVQCDQAALTGEGMPCEKAPMGQMTVCPETMIWSPGSKNQVFRGSAVCRGEGEMAVLRVGDATFIGEVAGSLQNSGRPSPLKHRLSELAHSISYLGYVGAAMIAFAYLFNSFIIDSGMNMAIAAERLADKQFVIGEILRAVTVAVSVIVVAVPEGLPMMITVVLSSNMKRMLKSGVLVRRLVGIETAGNMNILFTDKTGTLTGGRMSVCGVFGCGWSSKEYKELRHSKALYAAVTDAINLACSEGGGATEKALCAFARGRTGKHAIQKLPFNSDIKMSAALTKERSYFVGAPERLIAACSSYYDESGRERVLDAGRRSEIMRRLTALGDDACRVVCLAAGGKSEYDSAEKGRDIASALSFICLAAIRDPLRSDAAASVAEAQSAGIHVVMITGDNPHTAAAIAKEAGILCDAHSVVLEASRLHAMTDDEVKSELDRVAVVSRALPTDKLRLVRISQEMGLVAGMTGDGVNDAPALKAADVGFVMGSGTDIAKEAGDIVITNDSFASVTNAVLYGRTIFESIRKFIVFQLMMNLSAMGVSLIGPFIGIDSPVTVIQMLWVNIIMDTLGGLAFAGEPALRKYMRRPSIKRDAPLISSDMMAQIICTGLYMLALSIFFLKSSFLQSYFGGDDVYFLTAFFAMFIFCGIFNSFNARTPSVNILSHLAGNKGFILIMTLVATVQLLIIYFGGEMFRCTPLASEHLAATALIAATVIPADMLRKLLHSKIHSSHK